MLVRSISVDFYMILDMNICSKLSEFTSVQVSSQYFRTPGALAAFLKILLQPASIPPVLLLRLSHCYLHVGCSLAGFTSSEGRWMKPEALQAESSLLTIPAICL